MKKLLALLLVLALALGLTACGVALPVLSNAIESKDSGTIETKNNTPADTKAAENNAPADTKAPEPDAPATEPAPEAADFQELTAIDNDLCSLRITGIKEDSFWGHILKAELENKTEDQNLRFSVETASINGVTYDPYFSSEVAAGKKSQEEISFSDDDMNALLGEVTDVELTVRVYNADDWYAEDAAMETFHVYPLGQARATTYVREVQPTDTVLVDNDQFTFIVAGYDPEGFWGYTVKLYLVNKTDIPLAFTADNVSVNDLMCDPFWGKTLPAGKVAFSDMDWSSSSFEELGITDVEEIEFELRVYNANDFWGDDLYDEVLPLTP